jgi:hypothetical protein
VTATISSNEEITVTSAGGDTHTFTENGSFTFEFTDAYGNAGTATATVDWIDKTAPTATIGYSTTEPTNQDVVATVTLSDGTVTNNGGATTYLFTTNGSFTFTFEDALGNTGTETATVDWIDKTAPTAICPNGPSGLTSDQSFVIAVAGDDVVQYRYQLDNNGFGEITDISQDIILSGLAEGEHTLHVIGCDSVGNWQSEIDATVLSWEIKLPLKGDIDGSGVVDLIDLIESLQIVAGIEVTGEIKIDADINNDNRIGIEEALYILQRVSDSRN